MRRRNFILYSIMTFFAYALPDSIRKFKVNKNSGVILPQQALNCLTYIESFNQINQLLRKYGPVELKVFRNQDSYRSKSHFVTMNRTYGRWANFILETEPTGISKENFLQNVLVTTMGPEGRDLAKKSDLKIISTEVDNSKNHFVIEDAYPHFFNNMAVNKSKPNRRSYFVDSVSRKQIHLSLNLPAEMSGEDRASFKRLQAELQSQIYLLEKNSLAEISSEYPVYDFSELRRSTISNQQLG